MKLEITGDGPLNTVLKIDGKQMDGVTDASFSVSPTQSYAYIRLDPELVEIKEDSVEINLVVGDRIFQVVEVD